MSAGKSGDVTEMLERARSGDKQALAAVFPIVCDELRRIAAAKMGAQPAGSTLQTTALINEAYLRLMGRDTPWESRSHFFHVAARAMRSVLVDHVRARKAEKRGGDRRREPLHEAVAWFERQSLDLIDLNDALEELERADERKHRLVELRFFAGLTTADAAEMLGVSLATAEREWTLARAWLKSRMSA